MTPRLRIAPSPTGQMHLGTGRAALFNWLYARHTGGSFIVRIDDTDRERSTKEFEQDIVEGLRWLELDWDEGVELGGPHGTYRQSDRYPRYIEAAAQLVEQGNAYFCFCTPAELDERRKQAEAEGRPPGYDGRCRSISATEAATRRSEGEAAAIRFAMDRPGETTFVDLVRGEVHFDHANIDDFVILRSDQTPTYHLASTVDDVDYDITHVARGEDLLPSTPRHIQLTRALGAEAALYAHLPLLFGTDGKRLSKRHGARGITEYREVGYLPEALINYLGSLSWSLDGERTIFSREEAVAAFDLDQVSAHPAIYDQDKLDWMNGEYVRMLTSDDFNQRVRPFLEAGLSRELTATEWETFQRISPLVQERVRLLTEAAGQVGFLFTEQLVYDDQSWAKAMAPGMSELLIEAASRLTALEEWEHDGIETVLRALLEERGLKPRQGLQPIRVAITGSSVSPPLFESMAALGRERCLARLREAATR